MVGTGRLRLSLQAQADGKSIELGPVPPPYTDWVKWQRAMLDRSEGEQHKSFWRHQLKGDLPVLNLPLDFPRPEIQTYNGDSVAFYISPKKTRQVRELAQAEGVTLYMLMLTVYQVLLYRITGQKEIIVGTPTSGRNQPEFQSTVGDFEIQLRCAEIFITHSISKNTCPRCAKPCSMPWLTRIIHLFELLKT